MITGLFCHYLPIYKDVDGIYCSTTLTNSFFQRYFSVVDKLIVADRVYPLESTYIEAHQEPITLDGVKIEEFPNLSNFYGLSREYLKAKIRINALISEADLIFVRGGIIGILGAEAARKQKKPYLAECAGCAWDEYWNYSLSGKFLAPYMEYMAKKTIRNASHVVYVTEEWLQKRYMTDGISTNASNVILESIDNQALENRIMKISQYGTEKRSFVLGTTGGIGNKAKGQQFVIKAIGLLRDQYDFSYELVGGGDESYLMNIAKKYNVADKIVFKRQFTHEEVLNWLDSIDIYIQPSMQEGLPRALIEAMSRACPAIGSTTGGIPELLDKNAIFDRGKVASLKAVLEQYIQNDLTKFAIRNFNKAKTYKLSLINERRNKLYQQYKEYVLKGKNR